jgi:ribosomal protein S18 acetylase RimI-like enzyme
MAQSQPPAILLRPARAEDLGFAASVYLRAMAETLQHAIGLDRDRQAALLLAQWDVVEVSIIVAAGREVGWIQIAPAEAAVFIRNLCIDPAYQRLGIGSVALRQVIADAGERGDAVTLGVVKGSAARRFYERLGFRQTHDDAHHDYMRL